MQKSSIAKHLARERRADLAEAIGSELRRLRRRRGLTQGELGKPFTRAFVSAVELGYTIPSVPALVTLTERLGIGLDDFFWGVNQRWTTVYTASHEDLNHPP